MENGQAAGLEVQRRRKLIPPPHRCFFVVLFACCVVVQLIGKAGAQEHSVFDEPTPLNQLLIPKDAPISAELLARCMKQREELEKRKARGREEQAKLVQHQWLYRQFESEIETKKLSVTDANRKAVFDLERARASAQKNLATATEAYNLRVKEDKAAADTFNRTCGGRVVSQEAEDAVREKEADLPRLGRSPVTLPLTEEQKKEMDAYRSYLGTHVETDRLKAEVGAHRKRNAVASGSSGMQVSITISPTGSLVSRSVKVSSGDPALDAIVLAGVDRAQPFAPPPKAMASKPIVWMLGFFGSPRK